jgi:hypothetical protein
MKLHRSAKQQRPMTGEAHRAPDPSIGGLSRGGVTSEPHLLPEADRPQAPVTFLSTDKCARRAMLSRKAIYRAIESGELLAFRLPRLAASPGGGVQPLIEGVELRHLRPAVLDRYLAQLQRDGLSPASVKKVAGCFRVSSSGRWSGSTSPRTRCAWHTSQRPASGS